MGGLGVSTRFGSGPFWICHLDLAIARGRRRRRMDRSPDAGLSRARVVDARHGRGPRRREVNAPSVVSPFPFGAKGSLGVSPWSHGGGRWAGASPAPRAWQPRPPPVGRDGWIAGVNVSDGSCTRLRSGTSCERTAGTAGGPGTRGSPAERGIHEFYRLPKFARGDGVSRKRAVGARTAAWTRKATRDCFWDLAESFLRWKKRGTSGRRSAHGARIGRGNDWKDLSVHSSRWLWKKTVRAHHLVSRNRRRVGRAMTHLVTAARAARAGAAQVKEAMTAC